MRLLAFDTLGEAASAAVVTQAGVLAEGWAEAGRGQAEALLPLVRSVMQDAGLGFGELAALAVTIGPGGFTSVRTGVAAARGLALAAGLPVYPVDRLEALAAAARERDAHGAVAAVHDARRGEVVLSVVDPEGVVIRPGELLTLAAAVERLRDDLPLPGGAWTLVGDGAAAVAAGLGGDARVLALDASARHVAAVALGRKARGVAPLAGSAVRPSYVRPPDARPDAGRPLVVAA